MSTLYNKILERQDTRINLNSIIRSQLLAFDTDSNHLLYSSDGVTYLEFYHKTQLDALFSPLGGPGALSNLTASSFVKTGGTASQFLKANGTVDSTTYAPLSGTLTSTQIAFGSGSGIAGSSYLTYTTGTGSGAITVSGPSRNNSSVYAALEGVGPSFQSPTLTLSNATAVWGLQNYYGTLQAIIAGDPANPLMTLSTIGSFTVGNNGITNAFVGVNGLTSNTRGFFIAGAGVNRFMITLGNDGLSTFRSYNSSGVLIDNPITWANTAVTDLITVNRSISLATTSAYISFASGSYVPTFTTRSGGTKILLYPALTGATTDYAIGIESNNLWTSVPAASQGFKWYQGITSIMSLSSSGLTASKFITSGGTSSQFLKGDGTLDSNTYVTGGPFLPLSGGTLTGTLTANSIVKSGGTASQLLAADGSTIPTSNFSPAPTYGRPPEILQATSYNTLTASTTESTLYTGNIPANTMNVLNSSSTYNLIQFESTGYIPCNSVGNNIYKIKFGPATAYTLTANASSGIAYYDIKIKFNYINSNTMCYAYVSGFYKDTTGTITSICQCNVLTGLDLTNITALTTTGQVVSGSFIYQTTSKLIKY